VFSESGILERWDLNKKFSILNSKIESLKLESLKLYGECEKYRTGIYSENDILGAGLIYKQGKLLYINYTGKEILPDNAAATEDFLISLEHLRIIWILVSIMFLFYYFLAKKKSEEPADGSDFNRI
jgi:hypothetical protein